NANINLLPVDNAIVKKFVPLKLFLEKKGQKISDFDLLIASTALVYDLTLATRNKRHFSRIPRLQLL
ncbi:MAG: type II toxin-antitoxin system VapC family toxin, partial [bacterium]|nr:type II toxin-antitoxin system VapC family toxin [bacterium]